MDAHLNTCFITLGKFGDCCNTLPLVLHDYQQGNLPTMIVSNPYANLLDGVSYCDRISWAGDYSQPLAALKYAENTKRFDQILCVQCYGTQHDYLCDSFAEEAWRLVGYRQYWNKLPLVFDRRDKVREMGLLMKIGDRDKPKVLVSMIGQSSPFPYRDQLKALLEPLKDQYDFIDLDGFKAERFYDLIGLFETAFALIAIDSGPLHLAQAVPNLPVIALVTDRPNLWHGSPSRHNHMLRVRYGDFHNRSGDIVAALKDPIKNSQPRLVHAWNDYERHDAGNLRRHIISKQSWEREYKNASWISVPVNDFELLRNSSMVNDPRPVPFLKDIINKAVEIASPCDIIVFTNDDNIFTPGVSSVILRNVLEHSAIWGARWEVGRADPSGKWGSIGGYKHCGADIFAFTKNWWMIHQETLPDYLIARESWDLCFRTIINKTGGREVEGLLTHEIHAPLWHSPKYRESEGNIYNRHLSQAFFAVNGGWPKI